jgi:AcrR family transcriptional regulator
MTPATQSPDTKNRILDAAERMFADRGFDATSLRMITRKANVNLAAVNYHFQSKEALLHAVYARRAGPMNARRLELLSSYENSGEELKLESILDAFVRPIIEDAEACEFIPRLMIRLRYLDARETSRSVFQAQFQPVVQRFHAAFRRALPHLSEQELFMRIQFFLGALAHAMASSGNLFALSREELAPAPLETMRGLIRFAAAGLRAPALEETPCGS